jgi:hypothetical protein
MNLILAGEIIPGKRLSRGIQKDAGKFSVVNIKSKKGKKEEDIQEKSKIKRSYRMLGIGLVLLKSCKILKVVEP